MYTSRTRKLIIFLGKLECGFSIFCYKKASQAENDQRFELAQRLWRQAKQEDAHARMLWGLLDGKRPITGKDVVFANPDYFVEQPAMDLGNRQLQIMDGISQRYKTAQAFFAGVKPSNLGWGDTLAFMTVGEAFGNIFYRWLLILGSPNQVQAVLSKIASDEKAHRNYLWEALVEDTGCFLATLLIAKWTIRLVKALFYAVYDLP